jgi:FlaA1/EpsC-like NDP-sugar epimerase
MTIPEACSLVLKAGGVGENGALYLLDMGEPVSILDIAEQMIRFYGYEPEIDIKIETVGLRAGERLGENLWAACEKPVDTTSERIKKIECRDGQIFSRTTEIDLTTLTKKLLPICRFDPALPDSYRSARNLREILHEIIPTLPVQDGLNT